VNTVQVLQLDPDLVGEMDPQQREAAERTCLARTLVLPRGSWDAQESGDAGGYGLLVLDGVLCRRVVQKDSRGAELVGPGDLLRPWDRIGEWATIPSESSWLVIERARLAVLDDRFAERAARFPEVARGLLRRGLLRSRYLALLIAIIGQRRVETRLEMLFWHLADRFGQVQGEWIEIPVPLTHSLLAELVAARRPTVTSALSVLRDRDVLLRDGERWKLRADGYEPPLEALPKDSLEESVDPLGDSIAGSSPSSQAPTLGR
jgi:CRP-like cAMP-binding protein